MVISCRLENAPMCRHMIKQHIWLLNFELIASVGTKEFGQEGQEALRNVGFGIFMQFVDNKTKLETKALSYKRRKREYVL